MSRSYEGFLRWVSVEAMAELCAEAAQEMGFTGEPPTDKQKAVMRKAYEIHLSRKWGKRQDRANQASARRRARKLNALTENFTRREIIDRDQRTCHICGRTELPDRDIHLDHVIPLSKGGHHTPANVRVACAPCNIRKSDRMPSDILM